MPLLLTSSVIAYDTGVKLKNTDDRIRLAMESVAEWLRIDPALTLVMCDGSNFDFSTLVSKYFPNAKIECLSFENNQDKVRKYGRGYGEGEIVRFAVDHSQLINQAGCFAKCTSKLWVSNYKAILDVWTGDLLLKGVFENVFLPFKKTQFSYIDTRFYMTSVSMYQQLFHQAHFRIDVDKHYGLENSFTDIFLESNLRHVLSPIAPKICGVGGGTGKYYKSTHQRQFKEVLRLILVKTDPEFKNLFIV
jgi:hypothetical protein